MVEKISQHVDTLKNHYYIEPTIEDDNFHRYLSLVDKLISLKKEAQETKNNYGDIKSINYEIGVIDSKLTHKFNVMPTSISGFSVVIRNNDVSIALRKTKNKVNPSPVIKVEFRAEFLARKGYKKAIAIVNDFISSHLLAEYKIKISEIHLATDIQGYNFTPLDYYKMKTRARSRQTHEEEALEAKGSVYGGITTFTGMSFGGGDYHFRIYNKTKEISKFKNKSFAKTLLWDGKPNYNPDSTVWRLEIQIRRSKLKRLVNSDNSTLDDYNNILNSIPDLWAKALSDYNIKDLSDTDSFNLLRGKRTLKNGTEKLLTKNAIYGIFKRAKDLSFWTHIKQWNGHNPLPINTAFAEPKQGHISYVSNSIKSLYSTMAKHYGSVSVKTLIQAFKDSEQLNQENKQISLIEDTLNKQIDWFEKIEYLKDNGVVSVPLHKDLEQNIFQTVFEADTILKNVTYTQEFKQRLLDRQKSQTVNWCDFQARKQIIKDTQEARELF